MTGSSLAIKIMTRDDPEALRSCLHYLHQDVSKGRSSKSVTLIDDSAKGANRHLNKSLLERTFEKDIVTTRYFGREDWAEALSCIPVETARQVLLQIGLLGSPVYQPSRAKNVSQLVDVKTEYVLLLDDDILIDPKNESDKSIIEMALNRAKAANSYVSVNLMGFPDVSCFQLLERSIIDDEDKLHIWNRDPSNFLLSGGYLLYPNVDGLPMFPKSYNEDFIWVAYGMRKFDIGADRLCLNVYHSPIKPKSLSNSRLAYEAKGEILIETLRITNLNTFVKQQVPPSEMEIETAISNYLEYVDHVLGLIRKHSNQLLIDTRFLGKIELKYCERMLAEHIRYIKDIPYLRIQRFLIRWIKRTGEWVKIRQKFRNFSR